MKRVKENSTVSIQISDFLFFVKVFRGVHGTLWNICDGEFLLKQLTVKSLQLYLQKLSSAIFDKL